MIPPFTRIPHVLDKIPQVVKAICSGEPADSQGMDARFQLTYTAFLAIFDLGSMFFLFFVLISPVYRQWATLDAIRSTEAKDNFSYVTG